MKIGLDVDMKTNIAEGYLMAEFKQRELYKKGVLQKDVQIRFFAHLPEYCLEDQYGTVNPIGVKRIITDRNITINELWEFYQDYKKEIDFFIGTEYTDISSEHEALNLASDIDGYYGLQNSF